jgi:DNA-binding PadR family transcriptional regulator
VKLSSRQREFLSNLLDLYREAQAPVHYADVARALDVRPVTAYEMLRLLEAKGLVRSETARPQGHKGRSVVVFYPTEKATALLSELADDNVNEREWDEAKAGILQALEQGKGTDYQEMLEEVLLRIPERRIPLLFGADMVTAIIPPPAPVRPTGMGNSLFAGRVQPGPLASRKGQPADHLAAALLFSAVPRTPGQPGWQGQDAPVRFRLRGVTGRRSVRKKEVLCMHNGIILDTRA